MSTVGPYEVVEALYLSERGSVSRARRAESSPDAPPIAIKQLMIPVEDPSEPHWELRTFLDRAKLQHSLLALGARHWLPIRDQGFEGEGVYYAADYVPLSVRKLIESRVPLSAAALQSVISGMVAGLKELKALRGRPHGNLKPGNVLIAGGDLTDCHVLLSDLSSNAAALRSGESADVYAVGEIIYRLVTRSNSAPQLPIISSPAWSALGPRGESWRQLCNDLLEPDPDLRPTLIELAKRLQKSKPRRKGQFKRALLVMAAMALIVIVPVAALSVLDHVARSQFAQARQDWFGAFLAEASVPARRQRWETDPDLRKLLASIPFKTCKAIDTDSDQLIRWNLGDYQQLLDANDAVQKVRAVLPSQWKLAGTIVELRSRLFDRGWKQPTDYLASLIDGVTPNAGVDVAQGVDRLLKTASNLTGGQNLVDADWKKFQDSVHAIEATRDPVLIALAGALRKSALAEVKLDDRGLAGLKSISDDAALAERLNNTIQSSWPNNLDKDNFDRDVLHAIDPAHADKHDIDLWLAIADFNLLRHGEAAAAAADLRKRLEETLDLISHAQANPQEQVSLDDSTRRARSAITDLETSYFTKRTLTDGTFARKRDEAANLIEGLRKFYHPEGPEQWIGGLPAVVTASDEINEFWEGWRKSLRNDLPVMLKDHAAFVAHQQRSETLRSLLVNLDQGFSPPPPIASEAFAAAERQRREEIIGNLLKMIDLGDPKLDADKVKGAQDQYSQWAANVVALSRDFPISKEILRATDRPDSRWASAHPDFWKDPAVQALVQDDIKRLARIAALDHASRDELAKTLGSASDAEIALRAWELLGAKSINPPWPATVDELSLESHLREKLLGSFKALRDPREAEEPSRELAAAAALRWATFVHHATSEDMLREAMLARSNFGILQNDIDHLPAGDRYNLHLSLLRRAADEGDADAANVAAAGLGSALAELKDRPDLTALSSRIGLIAAPEPFADRKPGDVFTLDITGSPRPMVFKRIEPTGGKPFYLCETAASVGQFGGILSATLPRWTQARQLPWPTEPGKVDQRRGPRSWEWTGSTLTPPMLWLSPDEYNDFPNPLRAERFNRMSLSDQAGGNPTADHPVQYISAETALYFAAACGCRLPTSAEWQAAYTLFEKNVPMEKWNLRDQTWEMQRAYVAGGGGSRWPDEGAFPTGAGAAQRGRGASCRKTTDGVLFFQPVTGSGANVFKHLVGNVAQFTCDSADAFEQWTDKQSAEGIRRFAEAETHALAVIGGSALSAPDCPIDKPLPIPRPEEAWADVGVRLAFTAPSQTLAEKVKRAIGQPPYLWEKRPEGLAGSK